MQLQQVISTVDREQYATVLKMKNHMEDHRAGVKLNNNKSMIRLAIFSRVIGQSTKQLITKELNRVRVRLISDRQTSRLSKI